MAYQELDPNDLLSQRDLKTRFVPQSDDEEVLWTVVEITGERGKKFKVKWEGNDPATGKPWAQSWVAKSDCTDDLVVAWRAKEKGKRNQKPTRLGTEKGKRSDSAQSSRQSGSSKLPSRGGSRSATTTSGTTRRLASTSAEASTSRLRLDSVEQPRVSPSPPPKSKTSSSIPKRKRELEDPAIVVKTTTMAQNGGRVPVEEQVESPRPHKKQKTILEMLVPPLSTEDEDEDEEEGELVGGLHTRTPLQIRMPSKRDGGSLVSVVSDKEESAPSKMKMKEKEKEKEESKQKSKDKSMHRSNARLKDVSGGSRASDSREESRRPHSRAKIKDPPHREERVSDTDRSQDEEVRPLPLKSKSSSSKRVLLLEKIFDSSDREVDALILSTKVGPPRGVKRQQTQNKPKSHDRRGHLRVDSQKGDPADERVTGAESKAQSESSSGGAKLIKTKHGPVSLDQVFASSEEEVEAPVLSNKIGPPRGVKHQKTLSKSNSHDERGLSRAATPQEDRPAEGHVPTAEYEGQSENGASVSGGAMQDPVPSPILTSPRHVSIPPVPPSAPVRTPLLSPGAILRLELFDRMMEDEPEPDVFPVHVPDDYIDTVDTFDQPPIPNLLPSTSKTKHSKPATPNRLIVPETQSSGNSPSQSQMLLDLPLLKAPPANGQSLNKPLDLPTIAVIAASATSSVASLQELPVLPAKRPLKLSKSQKPQFKFVPHKFRLMTNSRGKLNNGGAPPSSIESFPSPQRVDKGKQRATEDGVQNSQGVGDNRDRPIQRTDSELKKRGKELFDRVQRARGAERQKGKKKQLKNINEIVKGTTAPSQSMVSPPLFVGDDEPTLELRLEEIIDLTAGANSTTLESPERSQAKPPTAEERERLRIELRQEEEESTQEAMDAYPRPPVEDRVYLDDGDAQAPPPGLPNKSPFRGDVDPSEQPSLDIQLASVIVQPSQGLQNEDMDTDPLPADRPTSSPARPIPENLTDSPKRRLGGALSLLNVKSEEIQRLERELADALKNLEGLQAELVGVRQSTEPTAPVRAAWEAERTQWAQERTKWENERSVWEVQRKEASEEKERLLARVAELSGAAVQAEEARTKLSELEAEREAWTKEREALLNDQVQHTGDLAALANVTRERADERAAHEVERIRWVEERARWETERAALQEKETSLLVSVDNLTSSVDSLTSAKASAERDGNFFREQYMQASGFVSSVRAENAELENRTKIAEGQAQEGVAAIKAMFEGRVKVLQADIVRWKGLTELLQEKDTRTNDRIRQRAALVPDMAELCGRLGREKKSLEAEVRKLGIAQHRGVTQRNRLYFQILVLKKERASLHSKLSQLAKTKTAESGGDGARERPLPPPPPPPMIMDDSEGMDPNDMDPPMSQPPTEVSFDEPALFPCMWRPQWRDQCQQVFDTKEDLERHLQAHFDDLWTL